jgi:DNA-binding winged helix-turn-helix (wHTH) protein
LTRLRFDEFVLDVAARQLSRGERALRLAPKVMDLLLLFAERPQRFLSKEELQRALWSDVRVGQASLPGLVKELRRVLEDKPGEGGLVRTLHGRGYLFAAALVPEAAPLAGLARGASVWEVGPRADLLDADTALSLPPDCELAGELCLCTLWPPAGPSLWLPTDRTVSLGRAETNDMHLPDEKVSRRHAEIRRKGPVFVLHDLQSTNGSYLDGERLREGAVLRGGQLLRLGEWLGALARPLQQAAGDQGASAREREVPASSAFARWRRMAAEDDWTGRVRELEALCLPRHGSHDG